MLASFETICRKPPNFIKIGTNYRALYTTTTVLLYCWQGNKYFGARITCRGNPFLLSHCNNEQSNIAESYMYFNDTTKGCIVVFPWQQLLWECATKMRYTWCKFSICLIILKFERLEGKYVLGRKCPLLCCLQIWLKTCLPLLSI